MKREYLAPNAAAVEICTENIICESYHTIVWTLESFNLSSDDADFGRSGYGEADSF